MALQTPSSNANNACVRCTEVTALYGDTGETQVHFCIEPQVQPQCSLEGSLRNWLHGSCFSD